MQQVARKIRAMQRSSAPQSSKIDSTFTSTESKATDSFQSKQLRPEPSAAQFDKMHQQLMSGIQSLQSQAQSSMNSYASHPVEGYQAQPQFLFSRVIIHIFRSVTFP